DARLQRRGRRVVGHLAADATAQRGQRVALGAAFGATEDVLLHGGALHGIELAVAVGGEQRHRFVAVHAYPRSVAIAIMSPWLRRRARGWRRPAASAGAGRGRGRAATSPCRWECRRPARCRDRTVLRARAGSTPRGIPAAARRSP